MEIVIKGGNNVNEVNVTSNSGWTVNTPTVLSQTGYVVMAGEVDDGSVLGYKTIRPFYVTQDYRLNKNLEKFVWQDVFNHSVLNNAKYNATTTNQTIVLSGGSLHLNANNAGTSGDYSILKTFKYFSLYQNAPVYVNFKTAFDNTFQTNNVIEYGLGLVTGTATPTDGIFFRASAGTLNGVVSYSGIETTVVNMYTPIVGNNDDYLIAIKDNNVEFWVNDILVGSITPTATTVIFTSTTVQLTTAGYCTSVSNSLPLFVRNKNTDSVASPIKVSISSLNVLIGDIKLNKDWRTTFVTNGQSSISKPDGQPALVSGTTSANIFNNTAPITLTTLDNTVAGYATLGGDFSIPATAATESEYAIFTYLNPAGSASIPAKTLVINNVYINTYTSGATVSATGTTLQWTIGVGGTDVSLTVVDSDTNGTRAARRLGLGVQYIAASGVTGTSARPMIMFDSSPSNMSNNQLIVEAGTYLHIILKTPVCSPTASLLYRGNVMINGYWE